MLPLRLSPLLRPDHDWFLLGFLVDGGIIKEMNPAPRRTVLLFMHQDLAF